MATGNKQPSLSEPGLPGGALWPLRLFLGITFIWASVDKLLDPQFLDPAAPGYLGQQLGLVVAGSPLAGLLMALVIPNATLIGLLIMGGELLVGLAVLLGFGTRFSAAVGLVINLIFYLTITWDIRPFYYGADIVFVFAWLTLLLAGPGPLSVDAYLRRRAPSAAVGAAQVPRPGRPPTLAGMGRRRFNIVALGALAAGTLYLLDMAAWPLLHGTTPRLVAQKPGGPIGAGPEIPPSTRAPTPTATTPATSPATAAPTAPATPATAPATAQAGVPYATPGLPPDAAATLTALPTIPPATATPVPATGAVVIAPPGTVPINAGLNFTNTQTGEPAVLVHLPGGYVAYRAICTHQGCTVAFSAQQHLIVCPCHASLFDPAQGGSPIRGPARRPLATLPLIVAPDGTVSLAG